jgi:hypothetical protein
MTTTGQPIPQAVQQTPDQPAGRSVSTSPLFAFLVLLFCGWALSLPLFPTQDGPMHKYYAHVIASLLSGSHIYDAYAIRHPLPPYAIHYGLLLGLTKFVSLDMAEKIFVCLILVATAYCFRYCARSLGPSGDLLSLCVVPLVLHWALVMGFLNYSLAVALFFLAAGLWIRAAAGRTGLWLWFLAVVVLLTLTHPVPLLLLIAFCGLDLAITLVQAHSREGFSLKSYRWQLVGLMVACLSFLYPLAAADRSRSVSNLHTTALHRDTIISSLVLYGISPFETRSKNVFIDAYRLGLYAILIGGIVLAARGLAGRWRSRQLRPVDTMLFGVVGVLIAIPVLPPAMNGSDYFAQRLMVFAWLGALAAASGFAHPQRLRRLARGFAIVMTAVTLIPAETFFRPVARQLSALEAQDLPSHTQGLAMLDPAMLQAVRKRDQLGFNPYLWSGALPLIHSDDVMLNSPWLDLTVMPVKAVPGTGLMVNAMPTPAEAERLINGNVNLSNLSPEVRERLLKSTKFIVLIATPQDVTQEISEKGAPLVGTQRTAQTTCASHEWYLVCTL